MPAQELSHRFQTAVLWTKNGTDNYGGLTYDPPVELKVRWVLSPKESIDPQGNKISLDAVATLAQEVPVGSLMLEARLTPNSVVFDGGELDFNMLATVFNGSSLPVLKNLMQVVSTERVLDLKGRATAFDANLMRYRDSLPTGGG